MSIHCHLGEISSQIIGCNFFGPYELCITNYSMVSWMQGLQESFIKMILCGREYGVSWIRLTWNHHKATKQRIRYFSLTRFNINNNNKQYGGHFFRLDKWKLMCVTRPHLYILLFIHCMPSGV